MKKNKITNFITEVKSEGHRIVWPGLKDTLASSLLVLIVVALSSLFFLIVDGAIYKVINYILRLGV